jgi:transposase
MHVDVVPNRNSRPCVLIRESFREDGKVKHRTVKNISDLPPDRIMAIKRALQGDFDHVAFCGLDGAKTEQGPQFGALYLTYQVAKHIGLEQAFGTDKRGKLALLMVLAQVIRPMSKRAVVEWARNQAVYEVLGIGLPDEIGFDENDLYEVLDDLADRRYRIEENLFKLRNKVCSRLFLYDVTSSYLEGVCNEFGDWGYNRDGKKGKKQIVIGLLTDQDGDPVAVDVFKGNTSDPKTVLDQIKRLSERFGVRDVVFVGDRGMIKRIPLESIKEADFRYITAITRPQVESLIKLGVVQLDLFDESLGEVEHEAVRYVFRRNPIRALQMEQSRQARTDKARDMARKLCEELVASKRKRPAVAFRKVQQKLEKLKIDDFVTARVEDRSIVVDVDQEALRDKARLDGVYMLKTDLRAEELAKESVHRAYKSLYEVETDFRTMKTDLEVRPVYVRKKSL